MEITNEFLKEHDACIEGFKWSQDQENRELEHFINALIKSNHVEWANWTIVRCLDKIQKVQYAVFAAEQVIDIFEKKYPEDKRPRQAVEAVKNYIKNPCSDAAHAARAAANAAYAAAYAAANAAYDAYAAAYAAYAAAHAAYDAYDAAHAARAAYAAAYATANAAYDAMKIKIIEYGVKLCLTKERTNAK